MKTYLQIFFNSEGSRPSDILDTLMNMGFKPIKGSHDFVYEWDKNTEVRDIIWFGDKIHEALRGHHVYYTMDTE
ncbi:MAG: hypothetical protein ACMUIG_02550 [Thermoplasmatota archaeon]